MSNPNGKPIPIKKEGLALINASTQVEDNIINNNVDNDRFITINKSKRKHSVKKIETYKYTHQVNKNPYQAFSSQYNGQFEVNELNQESKEDDIVYTDEPIEELNLERNFNKIHLDSDSKILTNYPEQRVLEIKTDNDKNKNSMTERGFKLIQVEGDGNCGFYSILATLGIDIKYHGNLRKLITDAMSNDEEILNGLAINDTDSKDIQIKTYINSMRKNGVWMSFSELVMFYKLTKFNIIARCGTVDRAGRS